MSAEINNKKPSSRSRAKAAVAVAVEAAPVPAEPVVEPVARKRAKAAATAAPAVKKKAATKKATAGTTKKPAKASDAEAVDLPAIEVPAPAAEPAPKPAPKTRARPAAKKAKPVKEKPVKKSVNEAVQDAPAAAAPKPALPTALLLDASGPEARLQWQAGDDCPAELVRLAAELLEEPGPGLPVERAHEAVAALVAEARHQRHELQVQPALWAQLALKLDAESRVARLETLLEQGLAVLPQALRERCQAPQLEAAVFAVSAGRALLADELGIGQREAALAALHLWRDGFGLQKLAVLAPVARHELWRAELPEGTRLAADPAALSGDAREVLVVDALESWDPAALRELQADHLHLLANGETLRDARLGVWVEWLDASGRGPQARLAELPPEAGPRERRELLRTVLLARRRRELADRLPARLETTRSLTPAATAPAEALATLQAACERWQRSGYATQAERAAVLAALRALREAELDDGLLQAQAQALRALADEWAPLRLRIAALAPRQAALAALLPDLPALFQPDGATALVHLDAPWSQAELDTRHAALAGERGVPVAWLLPDRGLSAALRETPLPLNLDEAPLWWPDRDWAALMAQLPAVLAALG